MPAPHSGQQDSLPVGNEPVNARRPMTGAQAVAHVIANMEGPTVYGIPGGYTVQIFDALHFVRDRVKTHLVREESLATVMAEAQGRLTGKPAVVIGQGAWVLGNAGIGIMEAHLGCSPMLILIDSTDGGTFSHLGPYQAGGGGYGAYDLPSAMRAITKQTFVASSPTQALQMTQLAIKHATTGEPGPVCVIFNGKSLFGRLDANTEPPAYPDRKYQGPAMPTAHQTDIDAVAAIIRASKRPVIISGNGVRLAKAESALMRFAKRHDISVATTPAGKGTFPEDEELALGLMGAFGHDTANQGVGAADLLIAVGTKLGASDTANQHPQVIDPNRQKLVQIDIEPLNLGWTTPVDHCVLGDAADALQRLDTALEGVMFNGSVDVKALREKIPFFNRKMTSTPGKFSGRDAVSILSQMLPKNAVVTCDAGENRLFMLRDFQSKEGGTVLQPNGGGGMGYAVPAAMAAANINKNGTAVAVCGDGGISMTLHGLLSAIELGLKLVVVVLDNQVLGWVYNSQRDRVIASEFKPFDYAAIAASMGCRSFAASDPESFRQAVSSSLGHDGVSVIVANTIKEDRYQDVMSSLHKYDIYAVPETP